MTTLAEVVGSIDALMGVKAVYGRSSKTIMCFGARGGDKSKHILYYSVARGVAEKSMSTPYFITIGAGAQVSDDMDGRCIELVKSTGVYGDTSALISDQALLERLRQWPVAVMFSEVYKIEGEPHLVADLGLLDKKILENAYDTVKKDTIRMPELWRSIKDRKVIRRWDVLTPPDFVDPGKVQLCSLSYPRRKVSTEEGKRIKIEIQGLERDRKLSSAAKAENRNRNAGEIKCEGCDLRDERAVLFDAHHLEPLASGPRLTLLSSFAILCPTCHRWAHALGADYLHPISVAEIRIARIQDGSAPNLN